MKQKKFLFVMGILTIIIILLLTLIVFLYKKNNSLNTTHESESLNNNFILDYYAPNKTLTKTAYFEINNCMQKYLNFLNTKNTAYFAYDKNGFPKQIVSEEKIKQNILNVLSYKYIKDNNITIENLYDKVTVFDEKLRYIPLEIINIQNDKIMSYKVCGLAIDLENNIKKKISVIVNIDPIDRIFSIEPLKNNDNMFDSLEYEFETAIKKNGVNDYTSIVVDNEICSREYIRLFKGIILADSKIMYNMLEEDYKKSQFPKLEDFERYVIENKDLIERVRLEKFTRKIYGNKEQYICLDQYNNIYVFNETSPMNYTVMLDSYTIDLPVFLEKYNNSNDEQKVLMNIMKIFEAINHKDYKYVYDKLDRTYRNNNFSKLEEFEKYMKENFFELNKVSAGNPKRQGDIYMYDVEVRDYNENNKEDAKVIKKTFVMRLDEGTNFTMSFSK